MKGSDHDVTIISVTAAHPDFGKKFIRSVRAFYPDIPFMLAGAADIYARCECFFEEQNVHYIALEAGGGVAHGLNACEARAKTRFILFCDAHCLFTDKTDPVIPLQELNRINVAHYINNLFLNEIFIYCANCKPARRA